MNITARLESTWEALKNEPLSIRELTLQVLILNEKIRILDGMEPGTMRTNVLSYLDEEFSRFLIAKEGGE